MNRSAARTAASTAAVVAGLAAATVFSGCVVGPDYKGPPVAAPIHAQAPGFQRAIDASTAAPPPKWWTTLGDVELNRLIETALADSPDLAIARARVIQARAGLKKARADRLPTTGAAAIYLRSKGLTNFLGAGTASAGTPAETQAANQAFEVYSANVDATWELDLFGGKARAVEGAIAGAAAAAASLDGARVSLAAEVAQDYVSLRDLQLRLQLSQESAEVNRRLLDLTRIRRDGGSASDLDLEQINSQLQSARADVTPLAAQITERLDQLAILAGREPGTLDAELTATGAVPLPPQTVAVGDPAAFLRRRPDIRQAERRLAQQNALIGQHTADLFPKITLLGTLGFTSTEASHLFDGSNFAYTILPLLQWSPFDFGRTRAQIRQAQGDRDEALANYRKTVLSALEDAETSLSRYGRQRQTVAALDQVRASADRAAALIATRRQGGAATDLDVLEGRRRVVQADLSVAGAKAQLTTDYIALQKSLGLGLGG